MSIRQRTFEQRHKREGAAARRRAYHLAAADDGYSPLSDIAAGAMHGVLSMFLGGPISPFAHGAIARGAYELARRSTVSEDGEDE